MTKTNTIWIVDDDEVYTFVLKKNIKLLNICDHVSIHSNGEKGISSLKETISSNKELPDIILLDINMPVMDEWQFMDEFVKMKHLLSKEILIYIASSSIATEDKLKAKSYSEISDYYEKPIGTDILTRITGLG